MCVCGCVGVARQNNLSDLRYEYITDKKEIPRYCKCGTKVIRLMKISLQLFPLKF